MGGREGSESGDHPKGVILYTENGCLSDRDRKWIQPSFVDLVGLFDQFGIHMNLAKNRYIICTPSEGGESILEGVRPLVRIPENHYAIIAMIA